MIANWNYIVIIICALLALIFAWQEYRRRSKANLVWRLLSILVAAVSLACIALPLWYTANKTVYEGNAAILLTPGFDKDSIKVADNPKIFTLDEETHKAYPNARFITNIYEADSIDQLHIYGDGLKAYQLRQLNGLPVMFHPGKEADGVNTVSWNDHLKTGEELLVQGTFNNTSNKKTKLSLKGLNTELASVYIAPVSKMPFTLSTTPKATGRMVYSLQAITGKDTTYQGAVPVQVTPTKPLNVLMLSASPDFETRFLKNWLSEHGYGVALRSVISKDKFNSEFINIPQLNLGRLSASALNQFDVVIGDLSVLTQLDNNESAALKQQVADKGLGVVVRADSASTKSWLQANFPVDKPAGKEPAPASLEIDGRKSRSNKLATNSAQLISRDGTQPLVKSGARLLANTAILGSGRIVFTTLNNTFSWMLGGNRDDYSLFWSALLTKAARKDDKPEEKVSFSALPLANEPVDITVAQASSSQLSVNNRFVAAKQDMNVPFQWQTTYWPKSEGWQQLKQGSHISWWYAYGQSDWQGIQAAERLAATKKYATAYRANAIVTKQIQQKVRIAVPKIYFYILLLAACTFLWIETKFS